MSAINRAAIDSLINTILTTQTAPDSVTPQTLDDICYAIAESYYNKVDGIQVSGMTSMLPGVSNGQNIEAILSLIMAAVGSLNTNISMTPNLFRAEKTADHIITSWVTNTKIITPFEDNASDPNFDNSKLFYRDQFIANATMVKTFVVEKLAIKCSSPGSDQWKVIITKNGTPVASSSAKVGTDIDEYGNTMTDTDGYTFPSLIAPSISLAAGDIISAGLLCFNKSGGSGTVTLLFNHPAGKPTFYNG